MVNPAPQADGSAPSAPSTAAPAQAPPPAIGPATPAPGAAQPSAAPPPRRSRAPRGPIPASRDVTSSGAPALLEIAAAAPMSTVQRRSRNIFVPDANHLFHVLGICDGMMGTTHRFLQSAPAWLPIVSQLYISVLWLYHIMVIYVNSGYGLEFSDIVRVLTETLRLDECFVPGPLVPFFASLAAVNGPFDWIGDVLPGLPSFDTFWSGPNFAPNSDYLVSVPCPAFLLDQLAAFAKFNPTTENPLYTAFMWYQNVFSIDGAVPHVVRCARRSVPLVASLFTTKDHLTVAHDFWRPALREFTRVNATIGQPQLVNWYQVLGFVNQEGATDFTWFQDVVIVMQKYSQYFNGSQPLRLISPVGLGSVMIRAYPNTNNEVRSWLYPDQAAMISFNSSRFLPLRTIPSALSLTFTHADHELEEVAEQYALLTATNVNWSVGNLPANNLPQIREQYVFEGSYWSMLHHREARNVNFTLQYAQIISSRYHQVTALRAE